MAASSWPLQDTENWRNGTGVMDQMVEITDGPPVFLCHFSCASERFKQMAMIFLQSRKN